MAIFHVRLTRQAKKDLKKVPFYVSDKLETWIDGIERRGLEEMKKIPGYHDESLLGKRSGQRSIRLSLSYRAIYKIMAENHVELVQVEEVSKHDY